jgi:hypothetical protein
MADLNQPDEHSGAIGVDSVGDENPDAQNTENGIGYFEHDLETLTSRTRVLAIQVAASHSQSQS